MPSTPSQTASALIIVPAPQLEALIEGAIRRALTAPSALPAPAGATEPPGPATVREAAQYLACSERQIRRLIRTGRLAASRITPGGSSRVLIDRASIQRVLAEGRQ
jgi:excisionase family DNA binding protein